MPLNRKKSDLKEREGTLVQGFKHLEGLVAAEEDPGLREDTLDSIQDQHLTIKRDLKRQKSATKLVANIFTGASREVEIDRILQNGQSSLEKTYENYQTKSEELRKQREAEQQPQHQVDQKIVPDLNALVLQTQAQSQHLPPPPPPAPTLSIQPAQPLTLSISTGLTPRPHRAPQTRPTLTTPSSSVARASRQTGYNAASLGAGVPTGRPGGGYSVGQDASGQSLPQASAVSSHRPMDSIDSTQTQHTVTSMHSTSTVESAASRGTFGVGINDAVYPSATLNNDHELAERFRSQVSMNTRPQFDPRFAQQDQQYLGQHRGQSQLYTTYHSQHQSTRDPHLQPGTSQYRLSREPPSISNPTASSSVAQPSTLPTGYGAHYSQNMYAPQNLGLARLSQYPTAHSSTQLNASSSSSPYPYHMAPTSSNSQPTVFIPPSTTSRYPAEQQRSKKGDWKQNEQRQ